MTLAVPRRTISTIVLKAFEDNLSVGEIKLPAALFTTTDGNEPVKSCIRLTVSFTAFGSRISQANGMIFARKDVMNHNL